jgi:hypothetical protein
MSRQKTSSVFTTGQEISRSGIYHPVHMRHVLPAQVPLLRGNVFPGCSQCPVLVRFSLVKAVQLESAQSRFRLLRNQQ